MKNKTRFFIWAIPISISIVIILLHLIAFIYDYKMLNSIYNLISINGYSDEVLFNLNKFLKTYDNQYLITGIEVVGIAISVWIGLNIYNIVKRDSIKDLEISAKETKRELEEFRNNYRTYNLAALENAKFKEERINDYLVGALKEYGKNILDYKSTKSIVFIEKTIQSIIENLDVENYYLMNENLKSLNEKLLQLKKEIDYNRAGKEKEKEIETVKTYMQVRFGDYNYYRGLMYYNQRCDVECYANRATQMLFQADKYYSKVNEEISQVVKTYVNNVRGFINYLLFMLTNNKDYAEQSYLLCKRACENFYGEFYETNYSRDHRNYGVSIEKKLEVDKIKGKNWYECMLQALYQYQTALKFDKNDVKTLTSISSCALKIFDKMINLTRDEKNKDVLLKKLKGIKDLDILKTLEEFIANNTDFKDIINQNLIQTAYNTIVIAQIFKPYVVETHYHAIHIYMYLILFSNDNLIRQKYIEKGINEISICESLYAASGKKQDKAFLFKARNFYFCVDDEDKGLFYHNLIYKKDREEIDKSSDKV